jgi:zinc D-Ala-D-Ala dipeptidase
LFLTRNLDVMRKQFLLIFLLWSGFQVAAQQNAYGLKITTTLEEYEQEVAADPENELINLATLIPGIVLDIRYATEENFTGEVVYDHAAAFLRRPAAEALARVQQSLSWQGLGLKVFDAYRPYAATVKFYDLIGDTNFVAAPWKGSRHNRGAAVDVTLINLETGEELPMPTTFDEFTEKASPAYMNLPQDVLHNRANLLRIMAEHGFTVYPSEWWHFDFEGWERFPLMDIRIGDLVTD